RTFNYANMDSRDVLTGDDIDRVIDGSVFNDTIELQADAAHPGFNTVTFVGTNFYNGLSFSDAVISFRNPSSSLTINGLGGGDTITVKSLDSHFAAELYIYGNNGLAPTLEPDVARDTVTFAGDVSTPGFSPAVFADT